MLFVCLCSLSVISGWIRIPEITLNEYIKTHKEQDKSSISFIFKFPTDWGRCLTGQLNSALPFAKGSWAAATSLTGDDLLRHLFNSWSTFSFISLRRTHCIFSLALSSSLLSNFSWSTSVCTLFGPFWEIFSVSDGGESVKKCEHLTKLLLAAFLRTKKCPKLRSSPIPTSTNSKHTHTHTKKIK